MNVVARLFKSRADATAPATPVTAPSVPAGQRVYAIGDIHGRHDLLLQLHELIQADDARRGPAETHLVFLGDLIDRGPDSALVVEFARTLKASVPATRILMGNHEEVFLSALEGDLDTFRFFIRIGGKQTLLSYGITRDQYDRETSDELLQRLLGLVPDSHVRFMRGFEDIIVFGDYIFVHAGLRPGVAVAKQKLADLRWIREPFLGDAAPHEKFVVHGHTVTETIDARVNRVGIDTGAFASGRLTAIGLEGTDRWFLEANASDQAQSAPFNS